MTMTSTSSNRVGPSDEIARGHAGALVVQPKSNLVAVDGFDEAKTDASELDMTKRAKHHKKWNRRLKVLFCCLGYKKNKDSIADVASIFAEFYADLKVPSSDLAAGFVLLSKYQDAQRQWIVKNQQSSIGQYLSSIPITPQTNFLDISTAEDSHLINDLIYYMNYSLAIFGWPMQMVDDPCMLCCIYPYLKLSPCCGSGNRKRKQDEAVKKKKESKKGKEKVDESGKVNSIEGDGQTTTIVQDGESARVKEDRRRNKSLPGKLDDDCNMPIILDDNCCGCNVASVERRLAAHNYEIIYVSYKVNVNVVPFLVVADHSKQSIVVAIRGSMSLSDMVTDMNGQIDKLPIDNCPDDWLCHRGISRAANYVKTTLLKERILDRAFNCCPDLGSQDYNLILCGHSLGAGVAAILGILIRNEYPNLKAYCYSPPGGILSLPAVEYTKQFSVGIILGNDCVARLGVAQLERLRYHVLLSLKSSQKTTGKILTKALCPTCCFGGNKVDYDPSQSLNLLYGNGGRAFDYKGNKISFQTQPQMLYVPSKLIHIVKNHTFKSKARRLFNEPIYQAIWNENTSYDRILISEGMFYDHLPNNLMHAMKMLFSKTLPAKKELKSTVITTNESYFTENQRKNQSKTCDSEQVRPDEDIMEKIVAAPDREKSYFNEDDSDNNILYLDDENNNQVGLDDLNDNRNSTKNNALVNTQGDFIKISPSVSDLQASDKNFDDNGNDETISNKNHR